MFCSGQRCSQIRTKPCSQSPACCVSDTLHLLILPGTPCATLAELLPPAKPQPQIVLLPSSSPVSVQYGKQHRPSTYGACTSGTKNASCGAVAWDVQAGKGRRDLSTIHQHYPSLKLDATLSRDR